MMEDCGANSVSRKLGFPPKASLHHFLRLTYLMSRVSDSLMHSSKPLPNLKALLRGSMIMASSSRSDVATLRPWICDPTSTLRIFLFSHCSGVSTAMCLQLLYKMGDGP